MNIQKLEQGKWVTHYSLWIFFKRPQGRVPACPWDWGMGGCFEWNMYASHLLFVYLLKYLNMKPIFKVNTYRIMIILIRVLHLFNINIKLYYDLVCFHENYRLLSPFLTDFWQEGGRHYNIIIFLLRNEFFKNAYGYMRLLDKFVQGLWYSGDRSGQLASYLWFILKFREVFYQRFHTKICSSQ